MTDLQPIPADKPIYQQIAEDLADRIRAGGFAVGDRLPSERDLADQLGISRMTVRQAFKSLTDAGLIESRIGRGCFVARPKVDQRLQRLTGFSEDMARLGRRAASVILRQAVIPAIGEAREALGVAEGAPLVLLERVRLADAVTAGALDIPRSAPETTAPSCSITEDARIGTTQARPPARKCPSSAIRCEWPVPKM